MARTERAITEVIAKYTCPRDEMVDKRVDGLAGHMGRLAVRELDRVSVRTFEFRNYKWIVNQADKKGNQGHTKYLHTWRWEQPTYKFYRDVHKTAPGDWHEKAIDIRGWNESLVSFLERRKVNR